MVVKTNNKVNSHTVTDEFSGQRLDKFLVAKLSHLSRSQIQKLIKSGAVLVNQKKSTVHQFLKSGDIIEIKQLSNSLQAHPERDALCNKKTAKRLIKKEVLSQKLELKIIANTKHFLIVNKPAGLLVHEATGHTEPTLVDLLLKKYPAISKIGEDPLRPGIVHRLDREVSGLLVVAKTQDMFDYLKKQFKTRSIKKEYIALVYGRPQKPTGEISFRIARSETINHKMAAVPAQEPRGQKAVTEFEVVKYLGKYTLLKITPQTGRTHQIRVHLNAFGLPIVGDEIYKPKKLKAKIAMPRIFLHAATLGFFDLTNKWREYTIPLPAELKQIIKRV